MPSSLSAFRSQYPEGRLISDLVTIQDGQYVVRTIIQLSGETLATGLAASADVQIAEDRARERAIAALGLRDLDATVTPDIETQHAASQTLAPAPSINATNGSTQKEAAAPAPVVATATISDRSSDEFVEEAPTLPLEDSALPPEEEDLGPPIDAIEDGPIAPPPPARPSAATIALESFNTSANPVDLSDVIAQTDVELTRLGWTSVQGREYLESTYGKRSRQQLTDEELMSFLLYLEDQTKHKPVPLASDQFGF